MGILNNLLIAFSIKIILKIKKTKGQSLLRIYPLIVRSLIKSNKLTHLSHLILMLCKLQNFQKIT